MIIEANIVDIRNRRIDFGKVGMQGGRIVSVQRTGQERDTASYILPGLIDAHVHIESSMLVPSEFARMAVPHGTVATVSDPHEIANVLGVAGVEYMLDNAALTPFKFFFGAPSCVPATHFETAGATIDSLAILGLLERDDIWYLAEMMNYPGVLTDDPEVLAKIRHAHQLGKPVDGHAPGVVGDAAVRYIRAGISTDHECVSYEEAAFKLEQGMKIIIREGSAARNFDALHPLISQFPSMVMLCSDDKHPDDLAIGHINALVRRALQEGCGLFDVLQAACINPVEHYEIPVGTLQPGDPADFIEVKDMESLEIIQTVIDGKVVFDREGVRLPAIPVQVENKFAASPRSASDFALEVPSGQLRVIGAIDGALVTEERVLDATTVTEEDADILKIAVINRYEDVPAAVAYIQGFGLQTGAIASSVAHDSHNIVAVGRHDADLAAVVNAVIEARGGIAAIGGGEEHVLPLPVAGLMSDQDGRQVAAAYTAIDRFVKETLGSTLAAPFMTLSFMALLVIPRLKLSDKGLFDGMNFHFVPVAVTEQLS
ncbi:MAG: adenine deaminase [Saprospiraceae bacterium]|nr:adenine deaminase [Saprospiraceae bacterium]